MNMLRVKPPLSYVGASLGSFAISADKLLRRRWPKKSSSDLLVTEISVGDIGNDVQELWLEKVNEKRQLLADRDLTTLRWHFDVPGDRGGARVLRCTRNGMLQGYAIVRDEAPDETGLRKSTIADLLLKQDEAAVMRALLVVAHDHAKKAGSHILEILGFPPSVREVWAQSHPYTRKYPTPIFGYKAVDAALHKRISEETIWYATPFDGDFTLIRPSYSESPRFAEHPQAQAEPTEEQALSGNPRA
jgi:hypothetical protein